MIFPEGKKATPSSEQNETELGDEESEAPETGIKNPSELGYACKAFDFKEIKTTLRFKA